MMILRFFYYIMYYDSFLFQVGVSVQSGTVV